MRVDNFESENIEPSDGISVKEAGRRGGYATLARHGLEFYRKIGKSGGRRTKALYSEFFREFGKKGGRPRRPVLDDLGGERDQY